MANGLLYQIKNIKILYKAIHVHFDSEWTIQIHQFTDTSMSLDEESRLDPERTHNSTGDGGQPKDQTHNLLTLSIIQVIK